MKKKSLVLALALCLILVACGGKKIEVESGQLPVNSKITLGMSLQDIPKSDKMAREQNENMSGFILIDEAVKYKGISWYGMYKINEEDALGYAAFQSNDALTQKQRDSIYDEFTELYGEPVLSSVEGTDFEYTWETESGFQAWFSGSPAASYYELMFN